MASVTLTRRTTAIAGGLLILALAMLPAWCRGNEVSGVVAAGRHDLQVSSSEIRRRRHGSKEPDPSPHLTGIQPSLH